MDYLIIIVVLIVAIVGWVKPEKTTKRFKGLIILLLIALGILQTIAINERNQGEKERINLIIELKDGKYKLINQNELLLDKIKNYQKGLDLKNKQIDNLRKEVEKANKLAEPNVLILQKKNVTKTEKGYTVVLSFALSQPLKPLGRINFFARLPQNSKEKILELHPSGTTSNVVKGNNGKEAFIKYNSNGDQYLVIEVSGKTMIWVSGSHISSFSLKF